MVGRLGVFSCVVVFIIFGGCNGERSVGDICEINSSGKQGVCRQLGTCPVVIYSLPNGDKPMNPCGFVGDTLTICCDESSSLPSHGYTHTHEHNTPTILTSPSAPNAEVIQNIKQKCIKYGESVYETIQRPSLGGNGVTKVSVCIDRGFLIRNARAYGREFPHQALLGSGNKHDKNWSCTGALISDRYVLARADCMDRMNTSIEWVRLGELNYTSTEDDAKPEDFKVSEIIKHPNYKQPLQDNIALVKLDTPVKFNKWIRPACLPTEDETSHRYLVTGWRFRVPKEIDDDYFGHLLQFVMAATDQEQCFASYNSTLKRRKLEINPNVHLCVNGTNTEVLTFDDGILQVYNKDVHCMYNVLGLGFFGSNNMQVFTKIWPYVSWIESVVWS